MFRPYSRIINGLRIKVTFKKYILCYTKEYNITGSFNTIQTLYLVHNAYDEAL